MKEVPLKGENGVKWKLMQAPYLIDENKPNEALVLLNRIWERISNRVEDSLHAKVRNNKAECLKMLDYYGDTLIIIDENLRIHGNNIMVRILKLRHCSK